MSAHEILGTDPTGPTPWEAGRIFRVFWRTAHGPPGAEGATAAAVGGVAIMAGGAPLDAGDVLVSWGVCARFPSGRVETWVWTGAEKGMPGMFRRAEDWARNGDLDFPHLVVTPPNEDGSPGRMIITARILAQGGNRPPVPFPPC